MARILIVEDDTDMATGLQDNLQFEGFEVDVADSAESALRRLAAQPADLILLDIMLPGMDGFALCRQLRQAGCSVPIIMLTARGQEVDVIRGLELGADDYVVKPFSPRELVARVKAVLRRGSMAGEENAECHH